MVYVFVCLISFSIIPSRSTHVVANDKISFFFIAEGPYSSILKSITFSNVLTGKKKKKKFMPKNSVKKFLEAI